MKEIRAFELAIKNKAKDIKKLGINPTLFWAYRTSKYNKNELIDFSEVVWDHDIEDIAKALRANYITEFTISCSSSGLIETLANFEKQSICIAGLVNVRANYTDFETGEHKIIPAIKMIVK